MSTSTLVSFERHVQREKKKFERNSSMSRVENLDMIKKQPIMKGKKTLQKSDKRDKKRILEKSLSSLDKLKELMIERKEDSTLAQDVGENTDVPLS